MFSDVAEKGCSVEDLLLEVDRILRPQGFVIVRDKRTMVDYIKKYLLALHWEAIGSSDHALDTDEEEGTTVLLIQKRLWPTSKSVVGQNIVESE